MNVSFVQSPSRTAAILLLYWLPAFLSVCLNGFIIVISVRKGLIVGHFKIFICYLAVCDFMHSFGFCFLQPIVTLSGSPFMYQSVVCDAVSTLHYIFSQAMFFALALIALNRYVSICKNQYWYNRIYTKANIAAMLAAVTLFSISIGSIVWVDTLANGWPPLPPKATACIAFLKLDSFLIKVGFLVSGAVSMPTNLITAFCVWELEKTLKEHSQQVLSIVKAEEVQKDKNLQNALIIQFLLAILCTTPAAIDALLIPLIGINWDVQTTLMAILSFNPVLDALTTICVSKPYRNVTKIWLRNIKQGHLAFTE